MQPSIVGCCYDLHTPIAIQVCCYWRWQYVSVLQEPSVLVKPMVPALSLSSTTMRSLCYSVGISAIHILP